MKDLSSHVLTGKPLQQTQGAPLPTKPAIELPPLNLIRPRSVKASAPVTVAVLLGQGLG